MMYIKKYEKYFQAQYDYEYQNKIKYLITEISNYITADDNISFLYSLLHYNNIVHKKFEYYLTNKDSSKYFVINIKEILTILKNSYFVGMLGELIVYDYLKNENIYDFINNPTEIENRKGSDIITIKNNESIMHQVKTIENYELITLQNNNFYFRTIGSTIQIKSTDEYKYLWFYIKKSNELIKIHINDIIDKKLVDKDYIITCNKKPDIIKVDMDVVEKMILKINSEKIKFSNSIDDYVNKVFNKFSTFIINNKNNFIIR